MKRKIIIIGIIIFSYSNAMEKQPSSCLLMHLPIVLLDYIATFLDDIETEQEFIERTQLIDQEMPEWCSNLIPERQFGMASQYTYCPNKQYIAIMQSSKKEEPPIIYPRYCIYQTLFIIDTAERRIIHERDLGNRGYKSIALFPQADSFGITHTEYDDSRDLCTDVIQYKTMLTIKKSNHLSSRTKKIELYKHEDPWDFLCHSIAFNKQGTHCIAHYVNYNKEHKPIKHHRIIPLTQAKMLTSKILANYFLQRRVCKDFIGHIKIS